MARSRNIKPSFFTNDVLAECPALARLLFAGLWTIADRDGRLEDRPKKIKAEILPYDNCSVEDLLNSLNDAGFIIRYKSENNEFIQIVNFKKHQNPHQKEQASTIPAPDMSGASTGISGTSRALTLNPLPESPIPHPSEEEYTAQWGAFEFSFRKIFDAGIDLFPKLATRRTTEITKWLEAGAHPDLDILPEIRRAAGKDIGSWNFFSGAIMDAKVSREAPLPAGTARAAQPEKKSHMRKSMEVAAEVAAQMTKEGY